MRRLPEHSTPPLTEIAAEPRRGCRGAAGPLRAARISSGPRPGDRDRRPSSCRAIIPCTATVAGKVPHAQLRMELATEHVEWFPGRFRHILDNLLSNALKYSDPPRARRRYFLGSIAWTSSWSCACRTTGWACRGTSVPKAFELFYRSAPARAAGLGVGLAVVKQLVEQSGGSLTVESQKDRARVLSSFCPASTPAIFSADAGLNESWSAIILTLNWNPPWGQISRCSRLECRTWGTFFCRDFFFGCERWFTDSAILRGPQSQRARFVGLLHRTLGMNAVAQIRSVYHRLDKGSLRVAEQ